MTDDNIHSIPDSTFEHTIPTADGPAKTLLDRAAALGIDVNNIDPTADSQTADFKPKAKTDLILGKFKTQTDFEKAYVELERKMSKGEKIEASGEAVPNIDDAEDADSTTSDAVPAEAAKDVVESAGLNFDALATEYWANNGLSDDSYAKLEKAGIPRAMVDQYAAGQQALIQAERTQVFSIVGGEDIYKAMQTWAIATLPQAEREAYTQVVNSGNANARDMAVRGLFARYSAEHSLEPTTKISGSRTAADNKAFKSYAELTKAMSDARYKKDSAYRESVQRRLANSDL